MKIWPAVTVSSPAIMASKVDLPQPEGPTRATNSPSFASNQTNVTNYDVMSAGVLIAALPPLLVYFLGGKYFVRGLTQGAVK